MEMMKKWFCTAVAALCCAAAFAQEGPVSYALPSTTVTLKVDAVKETFYAGPYARFAKKYLGIDARQEDKVSCYIRSIDVVPQVEADQAHRYNATVSKSNADLLALTAQGLISLGQSGAAENTSWRFTARSAGNFSGKALTSAIDEESTTLYQSDRSDSDYRRVAVQQSVTVEKPLEKRAQEAADMILRIREEKFNITTGNTDATFSGEALGTAIAELTRLEQEYMTMFVGYADTQVQQKTFDVRPVAGTPSQRYVAFRMSPTEGLVDPDNLSGRPFWVELFPEKVNAPEEDARARGNVLHYRIPAICTLRLSDGAEQLLQTRIPVYQLGAESVFPIR